MEKNIGTVRRVDELGRIVIPKSMRKMLDIQTNDEVKLALRSGEIVVSKLAPSCVFCGGKENLVAMNEKAVCRVCIGRLKAQF